MFKNMKLGTKIISGFAAVVLITVVMGGVGFYGMNEIAKDLDEIGDNRLPSVQSLLIMSESMNRVMVSERGLINRRMMEPQIRKAQYDYADKALKKADEEWKIYEPLPQTKEEAVIWKEFVPKWESWKKAHQQVVDLSHEKDRLVASGAALNDTRTDAMDAKVFEASMDARRKFLDVEGPLAKLVELNVQLGKEANKAGEVEAARMKAMLLGAIAVVFLFAISIAYYLKRNIASILKGLLDESSRLTEAAVKGQLATRGDVEKINFEFRGVVAGVNQTLDAVIGPLNVAAEYVDRISKGDIPPRITDSYSGDFNEIKNNLNVCIDAVNSLVTDAALLSKAAVEGKLAIRADAGKHQGDFRKIMDGVNETINRLVGFIDVMPSPAMIIDNDFSILYMNELGAKVAGRTQTESVGKKCYDHFKTSDCRTDRCACGRALSSGSVANSETDAHPMSGVDLDIAYTGVPIRDQGGKVVAAFEIVTDLTAIKKAERLSTKIANYQQTETEKLVTGLTRLSQGNTDVRIEPAAGDTETEDVRKTFQIIGDSVNTCVESINALVSAAAMLSQAAVEGKLATRADASKHQGDFQKIVAGVNDCLDSVIGPLNVAAEYVDRISKGDLPPRISDNYNGDFNEIKNNLNVLIDAMNTVTEAAAQIALGNLLVEVRERSPQDRLMQSLTRMVAHLKMLAGVAEQIADGDLTVNVKPASENDAIGNAFVTMTANLREIVGNVGSSSDSIATATKQIATGNADMAQRSETQASSLEEIAASMEELTSTVKQNADNSQQANQLAIDASDVAVKGGTVITRVVDTMDSISASSKKIADIISVIDGIAFQTNILALNAAVEAARAGEQGRGFAVVAGEVRNLAQRSAAAAKEIKELISDSVDKVGNGSKLVGEAGLTMQEIVTSIKRVTDIMSEISAASQEQSSGIEQVNGAITSMDEITQQNASVVQQASAAAGALEEQAGLLVEAVNRFKLEEERKPQQRESAKVLKMEPITVKAQAASKAAKQAKGVEKTGKSNGYHKANGYLEAKGAEVAKAVGHDAEWNEF
ncbi:MAG: methyl-accepting chemotaxis protein [Desulfuromonadaceae bacterium]|nr:methyl-accepting chemotaxis protein [Desulfuromonadaceae bacterium]